MADIKTTEQTDAVLAGLPALSADIVDQAISGAEDIILQMKGQNKIEVDMLALALIHTVLVACKQSLAGSDLSATKKSPRKRTKQPGDVPSDVLRPTE